jgi:hypothetical protein
VNLHDDDEPAGDGYKPDGGYIPRLLFMGNVGAATYHSRILPSHIP